MYKIYEVKTKKEQREFLNFPLKLYKDCPYFVPPLYGDEKKIFSKKYVYADTCDSVFFLCKDDKKVVGRISGILQKAHNKKTGEKRVRFTRFDAIDDVEVAKLLFKAVEDWAKAKGMDIVCGPLGYSDLEREGLLIEGFDQLSTFEEQYNYEYYGKLVEACGYQTEVNWVERQIYAPDVLDEKLVNISDMMLKKHNLHFAECKNVNDLIKRYADKLFALLDESYENIYGTVPFTDAMKKNMIANFKLIVRLDFVPLIVDENDNLVCFGLVFPSLSKAIRPSMGRLTLPTIIRVLKSKHNPEIVDLGLIGVKPEYAMLGISSAMIAKVMQILCQGNVKYCETNLNLEDNHNIQNQWHRFKTVLHKRRRAYIKKIS